MRPAGGGLLSLPPANPAFSLIFCPIPPTPFPAGRGGFLVFLCKGRSPLHPRGLNRAAPVERLPSRYPVRGSPRLGEKTIEQPFYWQCRQPRRGGTGGDGTIRRTRRRRLRWSSPPGRGEQVPPGGLPSLSPACPAFSFLSCPHPPDPLPGGKGETKVISCKGRSPLHPRGWTGQGASYFCRSDTQGTLRQEDRAQTIGFSQYSIFGKSSGGSGGLFQESPSVLPSVLPVPSANAVRRERVRERPSRCMTV